MTLFEKGVFALNALEAHGHAAYFVGGYVRDRLMGRECNDIDLATDALPQEVKIIFADYPVLETGIKHGTVTLLLDHTPLEITTFRTDGGYSDARHPDAVRFTPSLEEDLARRDFTINAMAYHPEKGVIDPYGGQDDLRKGVLRCVGDPETRFREDALRILRALRFSAVLGFSVEKETAAAMRREKYRMAMLSAERVASEVKKLLCGKKAGAVLCADWDILDQIFPFLDAMHGFAQQNDHHIYDVLTHTAVVVDHIDPEPRLRLAALLHDCGKPDCFSLDADGVGHFYGHAGISAAIAQQTLEALKIDKATRERVVRLVKMHDAPIPETKAAIKRKLAQLGEAGLSDLIRLQRADTLGLAPQFHDRLAHFDALERITADVLQEAACFSVRSLNLNGNDLKALGYQGKDIGEALQMLVDAVIEETVVNEKEALLAYLNEQRN